MGSSCSIKKKPNTLVTNSIRISTGRNNQITTMGGLSELNNIEREEERQFDDLPNYDDEYSGEGIKRIKAYKCNISFDELNKLRKA
jgi:hypothetical protein